MLRLLVKEILAETGKSKYWLYKQMGMSYQNFNRMINNETRSIRYDNIEALCQILACRPEDLFEYSPDE